MWGGVQCFSYIEKVTKANKIRSKTVALVKSRKHTFINGVKKKIRSKLLTRLANTIRYVCISDHYSININFIKY